MKTVLPANMLEIAITEPGDIDKLQPKISPIPSLPPHYLLIKVAASGVNRPDIFQRQGRYPPPQMRHRSPVLRLLEKLWQ